MSTNVRIRQIFTTTRSIVIQVDDDDPESALEQMRSGNIDAPSFYDPRWKTGWDLQREEMELA